MERLGFIHDKLDIKILILFILNRLDDAVDLNTLAELTMCDEGFGYFDFSECVSELVSTGHVLEEDELFRTSEKGRKNGSVTESSLPYSVRQKAEGMAFSLAHSQRRSAMIKTRSAEREAGGYTVHLSLSDGLGDVLSIEMLAGNQEQAEALKKGFRQRAEKLYEVLIDEITGNL